MKFFNRTRLKTIAWVALLLISTMVKAQHTAQIKGVVTTEDGHELAGVTVVVTETIGGKDVQRLATNDKGLFTISRLNVGNKYDVAFSYIGYEAKSIKAFLVNPSDNNSLLVRMREASVTSSEAVVVTALGIKREQKSVGYAVQSVNENAVKDARTNNWVNSLSGKVAGLNVQGTGSGPMGSSRITLRGESSLNMDNNQALIIVDGVPISSRITGTGYKAHLGGDSPIDFGSDLSDINPDDIEKITVLKGSGATALYGSRAAAGVILITTKSGRATKGLGVTYNASASFDQVNRYPDYQFSYGEGRTDAYYSYGNSADGVNTGTTVAAGRGFGPKFNGQSYFQYNPNAIDGKPTERTPWVPYKDYISGFFRLGRTITNSVALEGTTEKSSARLSITRMNNEWILPNTGFERTNVALSFNHKLTDKFKTNGKVNYTNKRSDNLPAAGYNNQTIMYFLIIGTNPNIRPEWYKPYWLPGLAQVKQRNPFNSGPDNPYLDLYEMLNKMNKNGVVGTASATYTFSDKLEAMVRTGIDMGYEFRTQQRPFSMTKFPRGMYREQTVFNYEINTDVLLTYKDKITNDLRYSLSAGANSMKQRYTLTDAYADQLSQPGVYQISNSLNAAIVNNERTEKAINSAYGFGQLSWREQVFLDVTGRNDWSSSLPYSNRSFFYPSVSTSFLLHELFTMPSAISFAKLRLSWAQVGNDTRPYQTEKYYDRIYGNYFTSPTTRYNPDLKPEITTSYEAGLDLRLLKGRLGMDVAVYNNKSRNQILAIPTDPASGFSNVLVNAGLINSKGIELQLTGKPVDHAHFRWTTTLNWSMNRSYVRELADGIPSQIIYSHDGNVTIEARVGGRMGDMYGLGFKRSPEGKVIYTAAGVPDLLDPVAKKWGNAFANWKAGLMNEFSIKGFRISILLDGQQGGSMYSQTNHKNNTLGKTKVTLKGRDGGLIGNGVVLKNGKYEPNTTVVKATPYYENVYAINNAEMNIFDASYLKLREMRVEFNLPRGFLSKLHVLQATAAVYGRDLFNITSFPGFDPEGGNLNSGTLTPGVELAQFPSTRNVGFNLTLKF